MHPAECIPRMILCCHARSQAVQVEVNRTFVSEWPGIGQVVLPLSECRANCSYRGLCMLWTGAPPDKGAQQPRCECYYGYRSRAIGPAGDFLVRTMRSPSSLLKITICLWLSLIVRTTFISILLCQLVLNLTVYFKCFDSRTCLGEALTGVATAVSLYVARTGVDSVLPTYAQ